MKIAAGPRTRSLVRSLLLHHPVSDVARMLATTERVVIAIWNSWPLRTDALLRVTAKLALIYPVTASERARRSA